MERLFVMKRMFYSNFTSFFSSKEDNHLIVILSPGCFMNITFSRKQLSFYLGSSTTWLFLLRQKQTLRKYQNIRIISTPLWNCIYYSISLLERSPLYRHFRLICTSNIWEVFYLILLHIHSELQKALGRLCLLREDQIRTAKLQGIAIVNHWNESVLLGPILASCCRSRVSANAKFECSNIRIHINIQISGLKCL